MKAWTGNYSTYAAAYAASLAGQGVYVADVTYQNPTVSIANPLDLMTGSPAIVLAQAVATPEPSALLLSVAGLLGLLAYAWRKRR